MTDAFSILVLVLADKEFREAYLAVQTQEQTAEFWHKQLGYTRIDLGLAAIEAELDLGRSAGPTGPASAREILKSARRHFLRFHSVHAHSTAWIPAMLTYQVPSMGDPEMLKIGFLGRLSYGSILTAGHMIQLLWYYSLLIYRLIGQPLKKAGISSYKWNPKRTFDQIAWVGYHVFHRVALAHWDDKGPPPAPKRKRRPKSKAAATRGRPPRR